MGIKSNFRKHLQQYYPGAFDVVYLDSFSNQTIAIDLIGLIYKYKSIFTDWPKALENYFNRLLHLGISPIIIFEGKSPIEKLTEQNDRKIKKCVLMDKIIKLKEDVSILKNGGTISALILDTIRKPKLPSYAIYKYIIEHEIVDEMINCESNEQIIEMTENQIEKYEKQCSSVDREDMNNVEIICNTLNMRQTLNNESAKLSIIKAPGEAEHTCAWLCRNGHVMAAMSDDSDLIALQCPIIISSSKQAGMVTLFNFEKLLECSKLTREQIVDWAILCGTDYNVSIPKIGVVTSFNIIVEYHNIDNFLANPEMLIKYKITEDVIKKLDHVNVRRLFDCKDLDELNLI